MSDVLFSGRNEEPTVAGPNSASGACIHLFAAIGFSKWVDASVL